mgnify:CR=1 FL=1
MYIFVSEIGIYCTTLTMSMGFGRPYLTTTPEQGFFNYAIDTHKSIFEFNEQKARSMLEETLYKPLLPSEREKIALQVQSYALHWFTKKMNEQYSQLDPLIFSLMRSIQADTHDSPSFPVLFSVNLEKEIPTVVKHRWHGGKYSNDYDIQARVPKLTREAITAYWKARAHNNHLIGEAYKDSLLVRILQEYPNIVRRQVSGTFRMIWAPDEVTVRQIAPIPRDPAIIFDTQSETYEDKSGLPRTLHILYKWDASGERDISDLVQEFITSFPQAEIKSLKENGHEEEREIPF